MKLSTAHGALGWALLLLSAPFCEASHSHNHNHRHIHQQIDKRHSHSHHHERAAQDSAPELVKKSTCAFPDDDPNMVAITPDSDNAGWAMSPDQSCEEDSYCPFACKPGMVMAQWDPDSTISYPSSMNGGLYCGKGGKVEKPFPSKPNCVKGTGAVKAVSNCGQDLSFCQTIFPGNEAMIIPTVVDSVGAVIAVPDSDYWMETSAHFYINPPGSSASDCVWGDDSVAIGNWSPYVAGANTDSNGNTFLKIGWNPEWEKSSLLSSKKVEFGVKVECPDGGCTGLPCGIAPGKGKGLVESLLGGTGDAGNDYCVVTVQKGSTANLVAYTEDGGSGSDDDDLSVAAEEEEEPEPTTSEAPTSTPEPEPTTEAPTTTLEPTTTAEPTTSTPSSTPTPTTTSTSTTPSSSSTSKKSKPTAKPGIFQEQKNSTASYSGSHSVTLPAEDAKETSEGSAQESEDEKDEAGRPGRSPAVAGLLVAFIAAACFF